MDVRKASVNAAVIIAEFEDLRLKAYDDNGKLPGTVWTIGYGHTKDVKEGDTCTKDEAILWLQQDCTDAVNMINHYYKHVNFNQNQFDALVSHVFNRGIGNVLKSALGKLIKQSPNDFDNIKAIWKNTGLRDSKGNLLQGLVKRRQLESELYCKPV